MNWFRKLIFKRRVYLALTALMYPASIRTIRSELKPDIDRYVEEASRQRWTPEIVASIVATLFVKGLVKGTFSIRQKEIYMDQLRTIGPQGLVQELEWLSNLKNRSSQDDMEPFVFRIVFMGSLQASWLVRDKSIDIYTKSIFVTIVAQALADVDNLTINEKFDELLQSIGTVPHPEKQRCYTVLQ
jgi:hypothetical protein